MDFDYGWGAQLHMVGLVGIATALGGLVGFNREATNRPAGLRTHMLVAGAAALIAATGRTVFLDAGGLTGDPNRPLQAVIMGIGFLGAGTIIRRQSDLEVQGLTTAASLFAVAAVGVAAGFDLAPLAAGVTLIVLFVLSGVRYFERRALHAEDED